MLLYLLVSGLSLSGNHEPRGVTAEIVYKIDSANAPVSNDTLSFLEDSKQVAGYLDKNLSPDSMRPKVFHDYSQDIIAGVVVLGFNGISVPLDISSGRKWQNGLDSCEASAVKGDTHKVLVICGPRDAERETTAIYEYELGRGITGFFAPCFIDKTCWYELQSKTGLLATLPAAGR